MEKTILKFELSISNSQIISMEKNAEILSIQEENGIPVIHVLLNPKGKLKDRKFEVYANGQQINCDKKIKRKFIGTCQLKRIRLRIHLFELI